MRLTFPSSATRGCPLVSVVTTGLNPGGILAGFCRTPLTIGSNWASEGSYAAIAVSPSKTAPVTAV